MKKVEISNNNYAVGKPYCLLYHDKYNDLRGLYTFNDGMVIICQTKYALTLWLVKKGRVYFKNIKGKIYTNIGIARKAGEFAREIFHD